jgi:hypothetical protein
MLPAPDANQSPSARAAALIGATQEANARRLAEAQAQAAAILAEAERTNAAFLKLAEEHAALLLAAAPEPVAEVKPLARIHPELGDDPRASIDGGVDLIAGPFARFSELAAFTRAVRTLQGITSLDTREFLKGTVHLRLRYEDPIQLSVRLTELTEFRPSIIQASASRIELRVNLADVQTEEAA